MSEHNLTRLLGRLSEGDPQVIEQITPLIYSELHKLARKYMNRESAGHTLQATALVNEAFIRLVDMQTNWSSRAHFYAIAATQMRHILIDHARAKTSQKRGGDLIKVTLNESIGLENNLDDLLTLDQLLTEFSEIDPRSATLMELRLFSGLSNKEIALQQQLSLATVERDLRSARAWLKSRMD